VKSLLIRVTLFRFYRNDENSRVDDGARSTKTRIDVNEKKTRKVNYTDQFDGSYVEIDQSQCKVE
jgi:hypothetical protein